MSTTQMTGSASVAPSTAPEGERPRKRIALVSRVGRYYLQIAVFVMLVVLCIVVPDFGSTGNLAAVATQASYGGIIACGMTLLIAGGLFDLSVAGVVAIAAVITGLALPHTSIGIAVLIGLATGTLLGWINGLIITKIALPPFIATYGLFNIYTGVAFIILNGNVLTIQSVYFNQIGTAAVFGVPVVFLVFIVACFVSQLLLNRTRFGRRLRAVGSSETAARMAGIPVDRVKIIAFAVTGLFTGLAAIFLAALLSSASGTMATGIELNAITIAVVGGTSLRGGQGTLLGTFTGAVFLVSLNTALNLIGVSSYWQNVAIGLVLVLTLVIGALTRRDKIRGAD
ncbi:MAG TPA: ABC transporter permease [Galbitalea sp.]|nr:ABC transporter permease [Galbitalea sp.]